MIKIEQKPPKSNPNIPQISDLIQKGGMNFIDAHDFITKLALNSQKQQNNDYQTLGVK